LSYENDCLLELSLCFALFADFAFRFAFPDVLIAATSAFSSCCSAFFRTALMPSPPLAAFLYVAT
jgi:hypothetical protein